MEQEWIFLGQGTFNKVYISKDGKEVLKIQKDKSVTDIPERSVRLWNAINGHINPPARLDEKSGGWICPFITGTQAFDTEMAHAVIDIFNNTGRIIVDATAPKNFLKTTEGVVVCVDIGMALQLEHREHMEHIAIRRKSITSLDVWSKAKPIYEPFFKQYADPNPITVLCIKALIFIKQERPDIYNADFLKNNPGLRTTLADAYDAQGVDTALAELQKVKNSEKSDIINESYSFSLCTEATPTFDGDINNTPILTDDERLSLSAISINNRAATLNAGESRVVGESEKSTLNQSCKKEEGNSIRRFKDDLNNIKSEQDLETNISDQPQFK